MTDDFHSSKKIFVVVLVGSVWIFFYSFLTSQDYCTKNENLNFKSEIKRKTIFFYIFHISYPSNFLHHLFLHFLTTFKLNFSSVRRFLSLFHFAEFLNINLDGFHRWKLWKLPFLFFHRKRKICSFFGKISNSILLRNFSFRSRDNLSR